MDLNRLLSTMRCATCGAEKLPLNGDIVCLGCKETFQRQGETVVMIPSGAATVKSQAPLEIKEASTTKCFLRRCVQALKPPDVCYISGKGKLSDFVAAFDKTNVVMDLGSEVQNRGDNVINIDIFAFENVDVVYDGLNFPFKDNSIDGILCTAVLEHCEDPKKVVSESFRVLKPGGRLLVTVPFMYGFHSVQDYQRYTMTGLETLLSDFEKLDIGVEVGPSSALADIFRKWLVAWSDNRVMHRALYTLGGWMVQPLKYCDIILAKKRHAYFAAGGHYYVGRKPAKATTA